MKLLGVVRLRQQRNRKTCGAQAALKTILTGQYNICSAFFHQSNIDTDNYNPGWAPETKIIFTDQFWRTIKPWKYQSAWEAETISVFGENQLYDGSGYCIQMGRNLNNSLSVLQFIQQHKWIDARTRVIFIEFALYGVNANLFTIVTIIAERTAYGNYLLNFNIKTLKLLIVVEDIPGIVIFVFILFIGFTVCFLLRLLSKLLKLQLNIFFQNIWNILDIFIVTLSMGAVAVYFRRDTYVRELLERLAKTRNNEFLGFSYAAFIDEFLNCWCGILVAIATVRLCKIFNFLRVFRLIGKTFTRCARILASLTLVAILFLIIFSLCVHLINGSHAKQFSSISSTIISLLVICFGFTDDKINSFNLLHGGKKLGILLYIILMFSIGIYILNMFITIICCYFSVVQEEIGQRLDLTESFFEFLKKEYFWWIKSPHVSKHSPLTYFYDNKRKYKAQIKRKSEMQKRDLQESKTRLDVIKVQIDIIEKTLNDVITQKEKFKEKKIKFRYPDGSLIILPSTCNRLNITNDFCAIHFKKCQ